MSTDCMLSYGDVARKTMSRYSQKGSQLMFDNDFGKCGPIFKTLSSTHLQCVVVKHQVVSFLRHSV